MYYEIHGVGEPLLLVPAVEISTAVCPKTRRAGAADRRLALLDLSAAELHVPGSGIDGQERRLRRDEAG